MNQIRWTASEETGEERLGNNLWEFISYNDRLQPEDMRLGTTQDGSQVWRSRLSYDPAGGSCSGQSGGDNNGNIRWQQITAPLDAGGDLTLCQTYGYDNFNRLTATQEAGGWSRLNSYDAFGNRTVNVGPAQTISDTTNRITAVAGYPAPPQYDAAGNMTFHPQIGTMAYDAENRQTSFSGSGKTGTYVYDGDGHRIKRVSAGIGGSTALFVYDAFDRLAAEYAPTAPTGADGVEYRTTDHLGSTRVVTDGAGAVVARRDFYPFGGRIEDTYGNRQQIAAYAEDPGFRQRFTGKERDEESNLDYFGARYFSANLGRFMGPDVPFADQDPSMPQSWNLFSYVRGNPLAAIDVLGRATVSVTVVTTVRERLDAMPNMTFSFMDLLATPNSPKTVRKRTFFRGRDGQFVFPGHDISSSSAFPISSRAYIRPFVFHTVATFRDTWDGGYNRVLSINTKRATSVLGRTELKSEPVLPGQVGTSRTVALNVNEGGIRSLSMDDLELLVAGANAMIQDQEIGNAVFVVASRELLRRTAIIREIEEAVARQALERAKRSDSPD